MRPIRTRTALPATVWAPPAHRNGPSWSGWVRDSVRDAFLPPGGRWWDLPTAAAAVHAPPPATVPAPAASVPAHPDGDSPADGDSPDDGDRPDDGGRDQDRPGNTPFDWACGSGSVDVVFADLTGTDDTVDARVWMAAARALRGGGVLAVLTRTRRSPHADLIDASGAIVAAAQNADLLYLQHIVVPTTALQPPVIGTDQAAPVIDRADRTAGGAPEHADLLVFAQPRLPDTAATTAAANPSRLSPGSVARPGARR